MEYETQLAQWQDDIKCAEDNLKIGQALKVKGLATLNSIDTDRATGKLKDIDVKELAGLIYSATQAIAQGVKLEADSRRQRSDLLANKPLKKSWE